MNLVCLANGGGRRHGHPCRSFVPVGAPTCRVNQCICPQPIHRLGPCPFLVFDGPPEVRLCLHFVHHPVERTGLCGLYNGPEVGKPQECRSRHTSYGSGFPLAAESRLYAGSQVQSPYFSQFPLSD